MNRDFVWLNFCYLARSLHTTHKFDLLLQINLLCWAGRKWGMLRAVFEYSISNTFLQFPSIILVLIVLLSFVCPFYPSSYRCSHQLLVFHQSLVCMLWLCISWLVSSSPDEMIKCWVRWQLSLARLYWTLMFLSCDVFGYGKHTSVDVREYPNFSCVLERNEEFLVSLWVSGVQPVHSLRVTTCGGELSYSELNTKRWNNLLRTGVHCRSVFMRGRLCPMALAICSRI